jgi:hypothetical protein
MTSKRNLHFLGYPVLIRGGSSCPFLRQTTVYDAMLLPEILKSRIHVVIPDFKRYSLKDTFHKRVFVLTK